MPENMMGHLEAMFRDVRNYALSEGYANVVTVGRNAKAGDVSKVFDLAAEAAAVEYCRREKLPFSILTEERGAISVASRPEWLLVMDPVDGSANFARGVEGVGFSVALLPYTDGSIRPSDVKYGLVGSIISGAVCKAEKSRGCTYSGPFSGGKDKRARSSRQEDPSKACIELDVDFALNEASTKIDLVEGRKIGRVLPLLYPDRQVKYVRRIGAASLGLMQVATGAVDAYVDVRDTLTAENWLAAYLLINEAGGVFTDWHGNEINEVRGLDEAFSVVAAGNPTLHDKLLKMLKH